MGWMSPYGHPMGARDGVRQRSPATGALHFYKPMVLIWQECLPVHAIDEAGIVDAQALRRSRSSRSLPRFRRALVASKPAGRRTLWARDLNCARP